MIDTAARQHASKMVRMIMSRSLSIEAFEDSWPRTTCDIGVRSVGFWLWTLFDDDDVGIIDHHGVPSVINALDRAAAFLESDEEFSPQKVSFAGRVRNLLRDGVEWRGAELPWHDNWPWSPVDDTSSEVSNQTSGKLGSG